MSDANYCFIIIVTEVYAVNQSINQSQFLQWLKCIPLGPLEKVS